METFFLNWYGFWKEKRAAFFILLGLFLIAGAWSIYQVKLLPNISLDVKIISGFTIIPLLFLLLFFKKTFLIPISLIPAFIGAIFSLSIYYLLEIEISNNILLIGAAISGVIYTYTIHLFSSLRKTESIEETIKIVFKPLFFGALITSCVFFFLMFSNSSVLKNVGLFGGLFIIGGLIGLLLVLPVIIQNKIKFRGKPISFDLGLFAIKNKLIRTGIVLVLIGVTIWFGFKMTDIKINSLDLIQNAKHIYIGFGIILVLLIMIYGRIEYALITFLPMVMSWIWTFGITSLIGLELNEYLIFVFSLIFGFTVGSTVLISDSYKSIYSYGDSSKNSSSTSILMVGTILLSTILILLVSDNPTMKSLALFTVISCLCFMLFSLFFQSYLIQLLIVNRAKKKKTPLTLYGIIFSITAFTYFFLGCVFLFFVHLIFRIIPFKQKEIKKGFRWLLSVFCLSLLYAMFNTKKRNFNKEKLDFTKPAIIISNHQSFLDILQLIGLNSNVVLMTNEWVYKSPVFGIIIRYAGYLRASKGIDANLEAINKLVEDGVSIVIFPEGTRSTSGKILRFHKGAFYLAEKTGLDILPVLIHGHSYAMSKGDYLLKNAYLYQKPLDRIKADDLSFGATYRERTKAISKHYRAEHKKFVNEVNDSEFQFDRIIHNYILKNPITEWYIRVKWKFEAKNYDFYNSFLKEDAVVYDLGCGYGYMSYYFGFREPNRTVIGMDYDKEKIAIAQNCFDRPEKIQFKSGDIRTFELQSADAIFLTDVIHYLEKEDQFVVLKKCVDALKEDGILFLRDGISDYQERHEKTKLTEKFSTKILGFNKSENELHFFSKQDVFDFAEENGLTCEFKEQSQKTSNVLFIMKK